MKPIEQLHSILCTGCKSVRYDIDIQETLYICNRDWKAWDFGTMTDDDFEEVEKEISLKHLMMYCNEKGVDFTGKGFIKYKTDGFDNGVYFGSYELTTIAYNPNKELYEQEDKELLDIINFLKG